MQWSGLFKRNSSLAEHFSCALDAEMHGPPERPRQASDRLGDSIGGGVARPRRGDALCIPHFEAETAQEGGVIHAEEAPYALNSICDGAFTGDGQSPHARADRRPRSPWAQEDDGGDADRHRGEHRCREAAKHAGVR